MFKKKNKQKKDTAPVAASHSSFDFSVIDPKMKAAARDYSALKAFATMQAKEFSSVQSAQKAATPPPPPEPPKVKITPEPKKTEKKKPIVSKFVILSGVFVLIAVLVGGGGLLWSLQQNPQEEEPPVTELPPPPTQTPPVTPPATETPPPAEVPGRDTDSDGLTDVEERLLGSDIRNPDTDGDSYLDGNEVFHGFDPTLPSPAPLSLSRVAAQYTYEGSPEFQFLKLNVWPAEAPTIVPEDSRGALRLLTSSGAEFRITLYPRLSEQTIAEWYDASSWGETHGPSAQLVPYVSKQGYTGRMTENKRNAFLDAGDYVVVFEYDLRTERTVEYLTTFQMMLNSFTIVE